MADLETTQAKLRSTPTAGVSGEHSAYYRRLLSAGYKGYIQGSIGGGTLYGAIGLGIGTITGLALAPFTLGQSLWLIPALGGSFALYGAHSFADIGKTAAIIADSADTNEKRRYLLDRYYETSNDLEAAEIKRQLEEQHNSTKPDAAFHWRPALIGALIGITLAVVAVALLTQGIAPHFLLEGIEVATHLTGLHFTAGTAMTAAQIGAAAPALAGLAGIGAAIGGLAGAVIGIDREYIRRWLDKAEFAVHETHHTEKQIAAREQDIERIAEAARRGEALASRSEHAAPQTDLQEHKSNVATPTLERREPPIKPESIAGLPDKPATKVETREAVLAQRLSELQLAPNI